MNEGGEPVLEPRHESDVYDEPDKPADSTREPHPVRAKDGGATVHRGHASKVPVLPGSRLGTFSNAVFDDTGGMEPGLKRYLGHAWQIVIVHHVADYEDLRVSGE